MHVTRSRRRVPRVNSSGSPVVLKRRASRVAVARRMVIPVDGRTAPRRAPTTTRKLRQPRQHCNPALRVVAEADRPCRSRANISVTSLVYIYKTVETCAAVRGTASSALPSLPSPPPPCLCSTPSCAASNQQLQLSADGPHRARAVPYPRSCDAPPLFPPACSPKVAPTSCAPRSTPRRTFKDPFVALIFAVIVLVLTKSRSLLVSLPEQPQQRPRLFDFERLRSVPPHQG